MTAFRRACDRHGALLAVNDRADIARAVGADVLHLGQDDLPVAMARQIVGPGHAARAVHALGGTGRRGRRRRGCRLLLRRAGLADPHQAGPPGARARPGQVRGIAHRAARPGSPSAASTRATSARCSTRERAASSWCGRSPRRPIPRPRPRLLPPGSARRAPSPPASRPAALARCPSPRALARCPNLRVLGRRPPAGGWRALEVPRRGLRRSPAGPAGYADGWRK